MGQEDTSTKSSNSIRRLDFRCRSASCSSPRTPMPTTSKDWRKPASAESEDRRPSPIAPRRWNPATPSRLTPASPPRTSTFPDAPLQDRCEAHRGRRREGRQAEAEGLAHPRPHPGALSFKFGNLLFSGDNIYKDGCVGAIDAHHGSHIPSYIESLSRIRDRMPSSCSRATARCSGEIPRSCKEPSTD